jgi:hypothetical protein
MTETFLLEIRPTPTAHANALLASLFLHGHAATITFERGAFPFEIRLHAHLRRAGVIIRVTTASGTVARTCLRPLWRTDEFVSEATRVLTRAMRRLAARHETLRRETVRAAERVVDEARAQERALEDAMRQRLARRDGERERRKPRRKEPGLLTRFFRRLRLV